MLTAPSREPLLPWNHDTTKGDRMLHQSEAERQHLLAMVEAAQRNGRSEREIIDIVDRFFGEGSSRNLGLKRGSSGSRDRGGSRSRSLFRRS